MRLDKSICLDAKFGRKEVAGMKLNGEYFFETTGPSYLNIYTIQIPKGRSTQATVFDNDDVKNENNYAPYIDWGVGTPITDNTGNKTFIYNYNNSTSNSDLVTKIRTTCQLQVGSGYFPGDYVKDIVSIRTDYLNGEGLFSNFVGIKSIREPVLERLDVSKFNSTKNMFRGCRSLVKLNLSSFDTRNVIDMAGMFYGCTNLSILEGLDYWKTDNVIDMNNMFYMCSFEELNLNCFNTVNVTNMSYMFGNCVLSTKIEVDEWDTGNVVDMSYMFYYCPKLASLDPSNWNTSNVTTMRATFSGCNKLTSLNLKKWATDNVTDMSSMFYNCRSLEELNISNFSIGDTTSVSDMLRNCVALHTLHLDNCDANTISKIINSGHFPTNDIGKDRIIYCDKTVVEQAGLEAPTPWVFFDIEEEPEVPVDPPTPEEPEEPEIKLYEPYDFRDDAEITEVRTIVDESHDDLDYMFRNCTKLVSINTEDWDTSNVTSMNYMFTNCVSLKELDLSAWDTNNVTYTNNMFFGCSNLEILDIRNFKAPSIGQTERMFVGCNKLRVIRMDNCDNKAMRRYIANQEGFPTGDIGVERVIYCKEASLIDSFGGRMLPPDGWRFESVDKEPEDSNTPDPNIPLYEKGQFKTQHDLVTVETMVNTSHIDLSFMFCDCFSLESVNTEDWDTSNVTKMNHMFESCNMLKSLDLSKWNTSKVTNMKHMFWGCSDLTELNLSNFNTRNVTNMDSMFAWCMGLEKLNLSNFYISDETNITGMFDFCSSLQELHLEYCDYNTVNKIISKLSSTYIDNGKVYVDKDIKAYLNDPPTNWTFVFVD
jgi:surface protein